MEKIMCEKCEQDFDKEEMVKMSAHDVIMGQGSWCETCADNYEPAY